MSRIEYLEGQRHATAILESFANMPSRLREADALGKILENLEVCVAGKPADYGAGIMDMVGKVRGLGKKSKPK